MKNTVHDKPILKVLACYFNLNLKRFHFKDNCGNFNINAFQTTLTCI